MVVLYVGGQNLGPLTSVDELARRLAAGEAVEVREDGGRRLGKFVPAEPPIPWEPDVTMEEIDRCCRESKRSSLDDILKRLGAE